MYADALNYLFKGNNGNTRIMCATIGSPEKRQRCLRGVFIVNVKHILYIILLFPLLTFSK